MWTVWPRCFVIPQKYFLCTVLVKIYMNWITCWVQNVIFVLYLYFVSYNDSWLWSKPVQNLLRSRRHVRICLISFLNLSASFWILGLFNQSFQTCHTTFISWEDFWWDVLQEQHGPRWVNKQRNEKYGCALTACSRARRQINPQLFSVSTINRNNRRILTRLWVVCFLAFSFSSQVAHSPAPALVFPFSFNN